MSRNISFPSSPKGPPPHLHNIPPSCSRVIFSVPCFRASLFLPTPPPEPIIAKLSWCSFGTVSGVCLFCLIPVATILIFFFIRTTWIVSPDLVGKPFPLLYVFCTLLLPSPLGRPVQILSPASLAILIMAKLMTFWFSKQLGVSLPHDHSPLPPFFPSSNSSFPSFQLLVKTSHSFCCCFHLFKSHAAESIRLRHLITVECDSNLKDQGID